MDYVNQLMEKKDKNREVKPIKIYKENVRPKNAYAIGKIGRTIYVALMFKDENAYGREVYTKKVHTLKTDTQERVDVKEEEVEKVFRKILFY